MNEVEFKKEIGEGIDYLRILKYRIAVICLIIALIGSIIMYCLTLLDQEETLNCDYDSCSQEAKYGNWNYNGSACYDLDNLECKEFLMLWDACQNYKDRIGVC